MILTSESDGLWLLKYTEVEYPGGGNLVRYSSLDPVIRSLTSLQNSNDDSSMPQSPFSKSCKRNIDYKRHRFSWMGECVPCFRISGKKVLVMTEPVQFFEALKLKCKKAKHRIVIASLYLGTGPLEEELVETIQEACENAERERNDDFAVHILLDYTRGSRGKENSRTMLLPLLKRFGDKVHVHLYHTPALRGWLKSLIPDRYNETIGLTHLKVYLCDDSCIISGANLSESYFVNRQDRYVLFNDCTKLADFFANLVKTVMSFSFQLHPDNTVCLPAGWNIHPFQENDGGTNFRYEARQRIEELINPDSYMDQEFVDKNDSEPRTFSEDHRTQENDSLLIGKNNSKLEQNLNSVCKDNDSECDTWVYPLVQMGQLGITVDEYVTQTLLRTAQKEDEILLASGYFNLTDHYMDVILTESQCRYGILMASPEVNGFYGARGPAGGVPAAYVYIAKQFYDQVTQHRQHVRIHLHEYFRDNWTFHVKGLWYYLDQQTLPSLTFVGSPNFGYRSAYRDLECQVAIVTENASLRQQLRAEHSRLYQLSAAVTEKTFVRKDRYVPLWVKLVVRVVKNFF